MIHRAFNSKRGWELLLNHIDHHLPREHDTIFSKGDWPYQEIYFKRDGENEIVLNGKDYKEFGVEKEGYILKLFHKNGEIYEIPLEERECKFTDFYKFRNFVVEFPCFHPSDEKVRLKRIGLGSIFYSVFKSPELVEESAISENNFEYARIGYSTGDVRIKLKNSTKILEFKLK